MTHARFQPLWCALLVFTGASWTGDAASAQGPGREPALTQQQASDALRRAVRFFREQASASGSYVYRLSEDLAKREGEGKVGPTTGWIEPPGTPSVGRAYLESYQLTRDPVLLQAATETGMALVRTQLVSGGWDNGIEFAEEDRRRYAYRVESPTHPSRLRNTTTFDDDKTQSAIRFLMRLDRVLGFEHQAIHEAANYALESTLRAQYPNGAWPQRYQSFPDPADHPIRAARYPDDWSREFPKPSYAGYYTLNDNTITDLIRTMLEAHEIYGDDRFRESAIRGGEFLLLAQMPPPQPGWAQQYNPEMEPAWARKFEPPAITGGESQGVMRTLMLLFHHTGDERFTDAVAPALEYYQRSRLPDGRLARFYELHTNRPLYFTKDYRLTYNSDDMPTHYAFIVGSRLDQIRRDHERATAGGARRPASDLDPVVPEASATLTRQAAEIVGGLDRRGAWVEAGRMRYHGEDDDTRRVIESRTFARNLVRLARFIAAGE